jgi:hypothetical protein
MASQLVPPQLKRPTFREVLLAGVVGAALGAVLGAVLWVATAELHWFYAVPICALIAAWVRRERPNVLWGQRAS